VKTNAKILIPVVVAVAAAAAYWMLLLSPKRDEIAKLDKSIAGKEVELKTAQSQLATYQKAKARYKANYTTLTRLGKAVPGDDDVRSLMVQLDDAADDAGVDFSTINVGGSSAAVVAPPTGVTDPTAPKVPPGAVAVGSAGFSALPFSMSFKGDFFDLSSLFNRMERFVNVRNERIDVTGRLLLVDSITIAPEQTGAGTGFSALKAQIGASSYLVPADEDMLKGATPEGPAGTSGGSTPAPAGGSTPTPPTTTATVTGVR
jgi:hypothetical protein